MIAEAATRLGITTDAVRRRLHRGTLPGEKGDDGTWKVYLEVEAPTEPSPGARPDANQAATVTSPDPTGQPPGELIALYQSIVSAKDEEITFLRDQLDQRSRELADERERFDVLQREALARIPTAPAPLRSGENREGQDIGGGANVAPWPTGDATRATESDQGDVRVSTSTATGSPPSSPPGVLLRIWRAIRGEG